MSVDDENKEVDEGVVLPLVWEHSSLFRETFVQKVSISCFKNFLSPNVLEYL